MAFNRIVVGMACMLTLASSLAWSKPPNVVMIISDDQAWTDFGFMNHPAIKTPHLDRLAEEGALFTRGYVPGSLCRCSLATLVTGLYPHQHGITSNDPPEGTDRHLMLRHIEASTTLPSLLSKRGYLSLQTGKWWEGNYRLGGFTYGMTHGDPAKGGRHGDDGLKIGREGLQPVYDFIEECGERPFFIWYAPFLPHRPHTPPERIIEKYRIHNRSEYVAKYWAMCEWFDETVGALLGHLDEKGLADDTLVVFVADNGWIQQQDKPGYAARSKRSPYDGGLRTPIILRWPGKIKPVRDETTPVLSLDLIPTILRACGLEPEDGMPGVDLFSIMEGKKPKREAIFGEVFTHNAVDILDPASSLLYRWCIRDSWKLSAPANHTIPPELYDVINDPRERHNVASQNSRRVRNMTELLDAWWPGK